MTDEEQNEEGSGLPKDPMNLMFEGAVQLHELYSTWVKAGFKEKDALYMLGVMMAESFKSTS